MYCSFTYCFKFHELQTIHYYLKSLWNSPLASVTYTTSVSSYCMLIIHNPNFWKCYYFLCTTPFDNNIIVLNVKIT